MRLGLLKASELAVERGEIDQAPSDVLMVGGQQLLPDLQGSLREGNGICESRLSVVGVCEIEQDREQARVIRHEVDLADDQRPTEQRLSLGVTTVSVPGLRLRREAPRLVGLCRGIERSKEERSHRREGEDGQPRRRPSTHPFAAPNRARVDFASTRIGSPESAPPQSRRRRSTIERASGIRPCLSRHRAARRSTRGRKM